MKSVVSDVIHHRQFPIEWFWLLFVLKGDELEELYGWRKKTGLIYCVDCCVSFLQVSLITRESLIASSRTCKCFIYYFVARI